MIQYIRGLGRVGYDSVHLCNISLKSCPQLLPVRTLEEEDFGLVVPRGGDGH